MVFNWGRKMVARQDDEEDMTMEEILASIRRYVADEKPASQERPRVSEFKPTQEPSPVSNTIIVEPNMDAAEMQKKVDHGREETIFELTEVVEEEISAPVMQAAGRVTPTPRPQPVQEAHPTPIHPSQPLTKERQMQNTSSEESMTSAQTMQASLSALNKLAEAKKSTTEQVAGSSTLTLDRLVADLARPMIKEWLDKHLAPIVEKMVAREIERITKDLQR